jgi:hypothetical protein
MTERWQDNFELDDDLKASEVLDQYKSPEAALKGLVDTKSRLGRSIIIPDDDADDTEKQDYYERLRKTAPDLILHPDAQDGEHSTEFWRMVGVPEESKEYATPEGFDGLPDDYVENMREIALKSGWTKKQFQATLAELATEYSEQQEAMEGARKQQRAIIESKLGLAEEKTVNSIKALVSKFADPDHPPAWLDDIANISAADMLFLNNVVTAVQGKGAQAAAQPTGLDVLTPSEIDEKVEQIDARLIKEGFAMAPEKRKSLLNKKTKYLEMRTPV